MDSAWLLGTEGRGGKDKLCSWLWTLGDELLTRGLSLFMFLDIKGTENGLSKQETNFI